LTTSETKLEVLEICRRDIVVERPPASRHVISAKKKAISLMGLTIKDYTYAIVLPAASRPPLNNVVGQVPKDPLAVVEAFFYKVPDTCHIT
jgi:hypothetical protein